MTERDTPDFQEPGSPVAQEPEAPGIERFEEESVRADIAAIQSQLKEATERHLRLAADFDNYRRRVERDRLENLARAQSSLVSRLLDVLDDMERFAHHSDPATPSQALLQGAELVERKLKNALEGAGLETIDPQNAKFDPQTMEAVGSVPAESADQDDTVADVFQKGYRFNGVLVRPARVRVRKHD